VTSTRFTDVTGSIAPSYPAIHKNETQTPVAQSSTVGTRPADIVAGAFGTSEPSQATKESPTNQMNSLIYKIQIGVFRNEPNASALANIPRVTSETLPESGLLKYFSGSWPTYEEAKAEVDNIINAGFPGAFVVAFFNGQAITLDEARKKE
jgi:hypothetical protein